MCSWPSSRFQFRFYWYSVLVMVMMSREGGGWWVMVLETLCKCNKGWVDSVALCAEYPFPHCKWLFCFIMILWQWCFYQMNILWDDVMMTAVTDQEEEEQWCLGLSPPPKEYITFSFHLDWKTNESIYCIPASKLLIPIWIKLGLITLQTII